MVAHGTWGGGVKSGRREERRGRDGPALWPAKFLDLQLQLLPSNAAGKVQRRRLKQRHQLICLCLRCATVGVARQAGSTSVCLLKCHANFSGCGRKSHAAACDACQAKINAQRKPKKKEKKSGKYIQREEKWEMLARTQSRWRLHCTTNSAGAAYMYVCVRAIKMP